ncbi:MAG: 1-deoxy-D-xylulose-5-phosphate reductoisomerase [Candidatus Omnitrophica bacterium]|nr:1-deoxy-D-xylulose-5-phosphate reductoisomerase [Candidatus Omnitrophota bacterium]
MRRIVLLGSTGSIGVNTLKVVEDHPEEFQVAGLAAQSNVERLAEQARAFRPKAVAIRDSSRAGRLQELLAGAGVQPKILVGDEGVEELAGMEGVEAVVVAITGAAALQPTLAAIAKGRTIGLANKETLVMAGELVMRQVEERRARLLPIDSEHSAIFQCLQGHSSEDLKRILLTTSGGPLKEVPLEEFGRLPKEKIMDHPRWKMGPKITVDSATMMNKALEVIEAHWLFRLPVDQVEVLVHPEAIVHSMVEFLDGSIIAQMGVTDMRLPIQYALTYPRRLPSSLPALDLVALKRLTFEAPDRRKFPCLNLGAEAARQGGTAPAALNAANEGCVTAFLEDGLPFVRIPSVIERVLSRHRPIPHPSLREILEADAWAREQVLTSIGVRPSGVRPQRV